MNAGESRFAYCGIDILLPFFASPAQKYENEGEDIARQKAEAEREVATTIPVQMQAQVAFNSLASTIVNEMKASPRRS